MKSRLTNHESNSYLCQAFSYMSAHKRCVLTQDKRNLPYQSARDGERSAHGAGHVALCRSRLHASASDGRQRAVRHCAMVDRHDAGPVQWPATGV